MTGVAVVLAAVAVALLLPPRVRADPVTSSSPGATVGNGVTAGRPGAVVLATLATGNVMLAFAAVLLGTVVGLQRRASGGILGPVLTHVTWSVVMVFALPALFGLAREAQP